MVIASVTAYSPKQRLIINLVMGYVNLGDQAAAEGLLITANEVGFINIMSITHSVGFPQLQVLIRQIEPVPIIPLQT